MRSNLTMPSEYKAVLDLKQTELAIKKIKDFFLNSLSTELRLRRVTAPLFVLRGLGLNDDLNGIERPVSFPIKCMNEATAEVVHSLAKWKRVTLAEYEVQPGFGIVTDMNAIRADEELDNIHSLYVDQWDWERTITDADRNIGFLKDIVRKIYQAVKATELMVYKYFPHITPRLPEDITFVHAQELLEAYPSLSPKERELEAVRRYGAVFVIGIGAALSNGEPHDGRAPDYDDWVTENADGYRGLNGDMLFYDNILDTSFELSSMGIRVSPDSLSRQLDIAGCPDRKWLPFHRDLLAGRLPLSVGGGIGQSRLCMYLLQKAHIGEVQASLWPPEQIEECRRAGIELL